MPMIKCTDCGSSVSDRLSSCPTCGAPIQKKSDRYSQFYQKPQTIQPEPQYDEPVERPRQKSYSKSTALSISAMLISFMAFLTSFMAIAIASNKPKEVVVEKEVPIYKEVKIEEESEPIPAQDIGTAEETKEDIKPENGEKLIETEKDEEPEKIEKNKKEETSNIFYVGDTLETKKVRLKYISCGDYIDDNIFIEAGQNNKLIYFEFEFENIGSTDTSVGFYDFDCYADGYEAKNSMCTADNAMTSITTLSPGRRMGGIVVFEVPQNADNIEIEYETSFWTQDKAIFIYG